MRDTSYNTNTSSIQPTLPPNPLRGHTTDITVEQLDEMCRLLIAEIKRDIDAYDQRYGRG
jgi:hypothetical protein